MAVNARVLASLSGIGVYLYSLALWVLWMWVWALRIITFSAGYVLNVLSFCLIN